MSHDTNNSIGTRWLKALGAALVAAAALALAPSALAFTWQSPAVISGTDVTGPDASPPATAMDAGGDAVTAWMKSSSDDSCPCAVRASLRSSGGSFGAPATIFSSSTNLDGTSSPSVAMDAAGDAIVAWYTLGDGQLGTSTGPKVYASVRPSGGSWGAPVQISSSGRGGADPSVAMDAAGDAVIVFRSNQNVAGEVFDIEAVRRPAGGSFTTPQIVTSTSDNAAGAVAPVAMSPNGRAIVAFDVCDAASLCNDGMSHQPGAEEVKAAVAPTGSAFASPVTVSPVVTNNFIAAPPYELPANVAIDDNGDAAVGIEDYTTYTSTTARVASSDAGGAFSSVTLGTAGSSFLDSLAIAASQETVAAVTGGGTLKTATRVPGGSFGSLTSVGGVGLGAAVSDAPLATASNAEGSSSQTLLGWLEFPGSGGSSAGVKASVRPSAGSFPSATTISSSSPANQYILPSAAIDKSGDSAVLAWQGSDGKVRVALGTTVSQHTLAVTKTGTGVGTVTSSPAGISCGATCTSQFDEGSSVALHATPTSGSWFAGWGGACTGTGACNVSMTANKAVTATFTHYAPNGSGTLAVPATALSASSPHHTLTFTYTAATGGILNGAVTLTVPSGWSAPSTIGTAAGYTLASKGTRTVSGNIITVSGLTLAAGGKFTITYGSKAAGGPGATAGSSVGTITWPAKEKSTATGTLTALALSPHVSVYAKDGSGTLTTPTTTVTHGSSGKTIVFTYTAAAGGILNGAVTLTVPSGWSAPSITGTDAGYTIASRGTRTVFGNTITVSGLTLAAGGTFTIAYGSRAAGGPGANAPLSAVGSQTWVTKERSTAGGYLTSILSSPIVTVT